MIRSHWIRGNERSRIPRRWVFLDTEAVEHDEGLVRRQSWRLAVCAFDRCDTDDRTWRPTRWETYHDPAVLWAQIDAFAVTKARTCVVAHNIGYDLRIAQAFDHLPTLGWQLATLAMHERSVSASFRKGNRSLVMVDSTAWLPTSIANLAGLVHIDKPPLPTGDDPVDRWELRCRADVEILRAAWLHLLDWIEGADLGNWQRTGAGMAWANWRHQHYTHRVLVHSDEDAQAAETASTYTGRCEAWRHGKAGPGEWTEWDLPLAYPRIAAEVDVPVKLLGRRSRVPASWVTQTGKGRRVLAFATIDTEQPTLPVRGPHGIYWPVGRVEGWWWDVELHNAIEHGADVSVSHCFVYRSAPALADWARWIIDLVEHPGDEISAVRQLAAKHWARALIGRFATRYTTWEPYGEAIEPGVGVHGISHAQTGAVGELLTLGNQSFVGWEKRYGADAVPAINAVIVAEARVRLWRLMVTAGLDHVAYCDTDSLIADEAGSEALADLVAAGGGWGLRAKSTGRGLAILGPRQLLPGAGWRIAGLPARAERVAADRWVGDAWEGIGAAFARGATDEVVIKRVGYRLRGVDNRRAHLPDGRTEALRAPGAPIVARAS